MTMKPDELKKYIKFALQELSSDNQHHGFEDLCRFLTKAKICSNVVPATGPVTAGGDQGIDFETFAADVNSYWENVCVGTIKHKKTVFACTTQKKNLKKKFHDDVNKTLKRPVKPEAISFFCTQKVSSKIKHEVQDWCKEKGIDFEVFDIEAISELLSDSSVSWISVQYLKIPADFFPLTQIQNSLKWLEDNKKKYEEKNCSYNYAEFVEIKTCLRASYKNVEYKHFLAFWITLLEGYLTNNDPRLRDKAAYEIITAQILGLETISVDWETKSTNWISRNNKSEDISVLEDVCCLISFMLGAKHRNIIKNTSIQDIITLSNETKVHLKKFIKNKNQSKGHKLIAKDLLSSISACNDQGLVTPELFLNSLRLLSEVIKGIKSVPLFPYERISERIDAYLRIPQLDQQKINVLLDLAHRLESVRNTKASFQLKANNCLKRSLMFQKQNQLVLSLREKQTALQCFIELKNERDSTYTMYDMAIFYYSLGLRYAAKQLFANVLNISLDENQERLSGLVRDTTNFFMINEYKAGNLLNFMRYTSTFMEIDVKYNPNLSEDISDYMQVVDGLSQIFGELTRISPSHSDNFKAILDEDYLKNVIDYTKSKEEKKIHFESQLITPKLKDIGKKRFINFTMFNKEVLLSGQNNSEITFPMERLAALIQFALIELYNYVDRENKTIEFEIILNPSATVDLEINHNTNKKYMLKSADFSSVPIVQLIDLIIDVFCKPGSPISSEIRERINIIGALMTPIEEISPDFSKITYDCHLRKIIPVIVTELDEVHPQLIHQNE